eukprot:c45616_g1_i1 orf=63-275(-)
MKVQYRYECLGENMSTLDSMVLSSRYAHVAEEQELINIFVTACSFKRAKLCNFLATFDKLLLGPDSRISQ